MAQARVMLDRLKELWTSPRSPTLAGVDVVIVDTVDEADLATGS